MRIRRSSSDGIRQREIFILSEMLSDLDVRVVSKSCVRAFWSKSVREVRFSQVFSIHCRKLTHFQLSRKYRMLVIKVTHILRAKGQYNM